MKTKNRIYIILTLSIAILSAFILVSSAEEPSATVTVTDSASLNAAITDSSVTYIKLGADFTVDEPIIVSRDGITIDLNGHTVTAYKHENDNYSMLFKLNLQSISFNITGSGEFNICRTLFDTTGAKNSSVTISSTGNGITVTSPDTYTNAYFKVGTATYLPASLKLSGKLNVLHSAPSNTFEIYKSSELNIVEAQISDNSHSDFSSDNYTTSSNIFRLVHAATLNISNSEITNYSGSIFSLTNATIGNESTIIANTSSFHALTDGYIVNLTNGSYSNMTFTNCFLEYTNCAFKENINTTLKNHYLNITLTDTNSLFSGTSISENALLSGSRITAIINGGFHKLNGAEFTIGTTKYDSANKGILIKSGTAVSNEFSSNDTLMVEDETSEIAKWFDKSGNLIAMGYYTFAETAELDASVLSEVKTDNGLYNLKYTSWKIQNTETGCEFTPDDTTMVPIPALSGIKYNISTYTNFIINIYVPEKDIIGIYYDQNCVNGINSASSVIDNNNYLKCSFVRGASDIDSIEMYAKYNADYNGCIYPLIQKVRVSIIDYSEEILSNTDFTVTDKLLAADMLRYCNETIKLAEGKYSAAITELLETYKSNLTDIDNMMIPNDNTEYKELAYYIKEASMLFDSYEPKFVFRYTENVTSLGASEDYGDMWLNITYTSVDGARKTAGIEINTDNSLFYTIGIAAYDIDAVLTIEVYGSGSDAPLAKGTFSLATYILGLESNSVDATFAKALYAYSLSAKAYKRAI